MDLSDTLNLKKYYINICRPINPVPGCDRHASVCQMKYTSDQVCDVHKQTFFFLNYFFTWRYTIATTNKNTNPILVWIGSRFLRSVLRRRSYQSVTWGFPSEGQSSRSRTGCWWRSQTALRASQTARSSRTPRSSTWSAPEEVWWVATVCLMERSASC